MLDKVIGDKEQDVKPVYATSRTKHFILKFYNKEAAILSRQHNDANILVLGSKFVDDKVMLEIIEVWLTTVFEGGRHERRLQQIREIEHEFLK